MVELKDAKIFLMESREVVQLHEKCVGFYIYRDMMGRTVIEDVRCDGEHSVSISGNEATKPFMLILSLPKEKPFTGIKEPEVKQVAEKINPRGKK